MLKKNNPDEDDLFLKNQKRNLIYLRNLALKIRGAPEQMQDCYKSSSNTESLETEDGRNLN
jgi:hypothetical protein